MKAIAKLTWNSLKLSWRTPIAFFFIIVFPLGFFFLYAGIFAHGNPHAVAVLFGPVLTLMALTNGLFGNGATTVMMRERGMLRPYHLTPLTAQQWILSRMLSNYIVALFVGAIMLLLACVLYHMPLTTSILNLWIVYTVGGLSIASLGMVVASVMNNMQESQIVFQLLFIVFLFFSGASIQFQSLPVFIRGLGRFLPPTLMVLAFNDLLIKGASLWSIWPELAGLVVTGVLSFVIGSVLFRWEKEDRATRRERLIALLAFLPMVVIGVWLNWMLG
ncbi:MAG: ABC transporter permease [Gammaproteobacteria bacterium]